MSSHGLASCASLAVVGAADGGAGGARGRGLGAMACTHFLARQTGHRSPADAASLVAADGDRLLFPGGAWARFGRGTLVGAAFRSTAGLPLRRPARRQPADQSALHGPADPAHL